MSDLNHLRDDWPAISARLDEALAIDADARATWLDALPDAESVKSKLRGLLSNAAAVETNDFLSTLPKLTLLPGAAAGTDPAQAAHEGASIGPYRLVARIGHGGMGEVWLAERIDGQPKRKVALKLPHLGWAPGLAARLGRERDILASLEHPHIARLYDAGVDRFDRPYLAMEYVDGVPIDRHCAEHALPLAARLDLLLQVCGAVAHAHSHLVVHRDLKPANILVTPAGDVRLLDFGIARLLEDDPGAGTDLTRESGRPLTPDYASPEQIRGEPIGTASDIYSLGVVAYEVIAGARPYHLAGEGAAKLVAAVDSLVVPPASRTVADPALRRAIAGDLDAILARALKRDAAERYPTVEAFAADLARHLRNEPVSAQPDRFAYRARKFVGRHRWQTASATLAVAALVAGAGVALWQAREARAEAARAEQVKAFALSMLESADTDAGAGAATTAVDLLQAARQRIDGELGGRPGIAAELMTAIGYGLIGQDRAEDAAVIMKKATTLAEQAYGSEDGRTLAARVVYGEALVDLGKGAEAIALLKPAAEQARRQHNSHAEIAAWRWLSSAQIDAGDLDAGVASARAAVAAVPAGEPLDRRARVDAIEAQLGLANVLASARRAGVSEASRAGLALATGLAGPLGTTHAATARLLLGKGLIAEGQVEEGLKALDAGYAGARAALGPDHTQTEISAHYLSVARLDAGDAKGAIDAAQAALDAVMRRRAGRSADAVAVSNLTLAVALAADGQHERALPFFDEAARLYKESSGAASPLAARALSGRALSLARLGRLADADRTFASVASVPLSGMELAARDANLAVLRDLQGRREEAIALSRSAADTLVQHPSPVIQARGLATLGQVLLHAERPAEAVAPLERALALLDKAQPNGSTQRAAAEAALVEARTRLHASP
jgi:eukaryotic-like serine/threonine-protein kinase